MCSSDLTGSTVLAATFFSDPKFEERNGLGYDSVQRVTDGHRFGSREELLAAQAAEPSTLVLWHVLDIENNTHHRFVRPSFSFRCRRERDRLS